ncbi:MAG: hypothetical protein R3E58_01630 [Phycisphaerae bacterium]
MHEDYQIIGDKRFQLLTIAKSRLSGIANDRGGRAKDRGARMIPMSVAQVAWAANATPSSAVEDGMITGVSTDSRAVKEGELFVAIKGDRFGTTTSNRPSRAAGLRRVW